MKTILLSFIMLLCATAQLAAQTFTDGLMMPKKDLCTGFLYSQDQWKDYWEGSLKRDNPNIGTITTTQIMWVGVYGVTDKVNIIGMLPYVKTSASGGTLTGLEGIQDLTVAVKYNLLKKDIGSGNLSLFGVGSFSTPLTDYTPDFLPLSIGVASTTASGRLTAYYKLNKGWYANASAGYVWRSNVSLDRISYFTDGVSYNTNQVWMPNQITAIYSLGYQKYGIIAEINLSTQNTLGGGDIRKQDMPFVSNRMNFLKVGATVMYYLPKPKGLAVRAQFSYTASGINVGQSTTLTGGLLYTIHFAKKQ
jgi:Putative MetA-pathway of phenol degradation